jgi:cytochrome P450
MIMTIQVNSAVEVSEAPLEQRDQKKRDQTTRNYFQELAGVPASESFTLIRHWMDTEPHHFFKYLREHKPNLTTPVCSLVTRNDDVIEVLSQPSVFTVSMYKPKMGDYLMTHDDDPLHFREKSIMRSMLNRDDLPAVRKMVAKNAKAILDAANGEIELAGDYCRMVPTTIVQDYFGLDGIDPRKLIEWSYWNQRNSFHNYPFNLLTDEQRDHIVQMHDSTGKELAKYVTGLIAKRLGPVKAAKATGLAFIRYTLSGWLDRLRGKPQKLRDDILTRMLLTSYPAAVDFPIQRLGLNAGGLLIGAVETTAQAVAQIMDELMSRPEVLAEAQAAARSGDDQKFDGYVWEALRYQPITHFLFRVAATDYTIAKGTGRELSVKKGDMVLAVVLSAMFDPQKFANPDTFDPTRDWTGHYHFGYGHHECLGKYVALVMIPEMVRQILLRDNLRVTSDIDYKGGPFPEEYRFSFS